MYAADRLELQDWLCSVPLAAFGGWLRAESFIDEAALLEAAIGLPASPPTAAVPDTASMAAGDGAASAAASASAAAPTAERQPRVARLPAGIPRLAASKIATFCGFGHPNGSKEIPDMFTEYLYQDNRGGFSADTALLGLSVVTEEQQLAEIIAKVD